MAAARLVAICMFTVLTSLTNYISECTYTAVDDLGTGHEAILIICRSVTATLHIHATLAATLRGLHRGTVCKNKSFSYIISSVVQL
jgi:hypothetical protein